MTISSRPASNRQAYLLLALGLVCISFSGLFVRWSGAPGTITTFYRLLFASLILLPIFLRQKDRPHLSAGLPVWGIGILGGLFTALDQGIWSISIIHTRIANATLLNNIAPLWVALFAWLFWKQQLRAAFWWGLILAFAGMLLMVSQDLGQNMRLGYGDLMGILSSFAFAGYFLAGQAGRKRLPAMSYLWVMTFSAMLVLLVWTSVSGELFHRYPPRAFLIFFLAALVSQTVGHFCITWAMGHLPASVIAPTSVAQPVISSLLAIPLMGEWLLPIEWLGGVLAILGIYLVNTRGTLPRELAVIQPLAEEP